jgi:hypothetical protein
MIVSTRELKDAFTTYGVPWFDKVGRFEAARLGGNVVGARDHLEGLLASSPIRIQVLRTWAFERGLLNSP